MVANSSKNVLSIVSYPFLPAKFGGQKGIALFYKYLSKEINIVCVTTKKNIPAEAEGYKVLNILSNSQLRYINIFYFFTLRKIIKQQQPGHILLEHPYYGWLALLLKYFCNVKLVIHSHNIEALRWKSLGKWWWPILWHYERIVHKNADHNFFITNEDREYAIKNYKLQRNKCTTITYGIEWDKAPSAQLRDDSRNQLCQLHNIKPEKKILLFNGAFNYKPNRDALYTIVKKINPLLQEVENFHYHILVCGKDIPADLSVEQFPNISLIGFVDDINLYFLGADIFLNPLADGGGIKTKLVEALGSGLSAVSTENGAIGVDASICNGKLVIVGDNERKGFTQAIINTANKSGGIPDDFFKWFYWGNVVKRAVNAILSL